MATLGSVAKKAQKELTKVFTSLKDRSVKIYPSRLNATDLVKLTTTHASDKKPKGALNTTAGTAGALTPTGRTAIPSTTDIAPYRTDLSVPGIRPAAEPSLNFLPGASVVGGIGTKLKSDANAAGKRTGTKAAQNAAKKPPKPVRRVIDVINFPGVQSIEFNFEPQIAITRGLRANFIQPWFEAPVTVTVTGLLYMGSFNAQKAQPAIEDLLEALRTLSNSIRGIGMKATPLVPTISGDQVGEGYTMTIGEVADAYSIQLNGYVTRLSYTEAIAEPFILNYTLGFTGILMALSDIQKARKDAKSKVTNAFQLAQRPAGLADVMKDKSNIGSIGDKLKSSFPGPSTALTAA